MSEEIMGISVFQQEIRNGTIPAIYNKKWTPKNTHYFFFGHEHTQLFLNQQTRGKALPLWNKKRKIHNIVYKNTLLIIVLPVAHILEPRRGERVVGCFCCCWNDSVTQTKNIIIIIFNHHHDLLLLLLVSNLCLGDYDLKSIANTR